MTAQPGFEPHVTDLGSGIDVALALHCTLAHGGAWKGVARALPNTTRLIAPDMPSHGRSPDWDGQSDYGLTCLSASQACLLGPSHVIGHSFGAVIALWLALEAPHMVRSLTLIEPVFFAVAREEAPDHLDAAMDVFKPVMSALELGQIEQAARIFHGVWGGSAPWQSLPPAARDAMMRAMPVVAATEALLFHDSADLIERLDRLSCPVALIKGSDSPPVMEGIMRGLHRHIQHAELHEIPGAGHMCPITHPAEVTSVISSQMGKKL